LYKWPIHDVFGISYAVSFIIHWMQLPVIGLTVHKFMTYTAKILNPLIKILIYGLTETSIY
jgi:hypothetical protein